MPELENIGAGGGVGGKEMVAAPDRRTSSTSTTDTISTSLVWFQLQCNKPWCTRKDIAFVWSLASTLLHSLPTMHCFSL